MLIIIQVNSKVILVTTKFNFCVSRRPPSSVTFPITHFITNIDCCSDENWTFVLKYHENCLHWGSGSVGISTSTLEHTEYQTLYLKQKFWCKLRIGKSKLIVIFSGYCCHVHNCLLNKISKSIITIFQYAIPISHCLECLSSSNIAFLKEINTVLEVDYCCYFIWFYGSTSVADFKYHQGVV